MKQKNMKTAAIVFVAGLIAAIIACLLVGAKVEPAIKEHAFNYSITYKLDGEVKTIKGIYTSRFTGHDDEYGIDRYYDGYYNIDGKVQEDRTYTIQEKDGYELYIVMLFNDCYLMEDKRADYYEPALEPPVLEAMSKDGMEQRGEDDLPSIFDAEIVSWEYPEPIDNKFVFCGFSHLHTSSMVALVVVGLLLIIACIIFVKRDKENRLKVIDWISLVFNVLSGVFVVPILILLIAFMQLTIDGDSLIYQIFLCIPGATMFTIAASLALRRLGYSKTGFFVQFIMPVVFILWLVVEAIVYNFA